MEFPKRLETPAKVTISITLPEKSLSISITLRLSDYPPAYFTSTMSASLDDMTKVSWIALSKESVLAHLLPWRALVLFLPAVDIINNN